MSRRKGNVNRKMTNRAWTWLYRLPSRPLSYCCGLNQPRVLENGWVLAMLAVLRVAVVQRERVPLSLSFGRLSGAAHERTLTA
jgi:hypothetical protein